MSYTVGQVKTHVLHSMREASSAGEAADSEAINDYLYSIVPFINEWQLQIATEKNCICGLYEIASEMPENQLENDWATYEHTADDISYGAAGSKAYSFQVDRNATVYIEEETGTETWTTLETITPAAISGAGFVTYKGIIEASDPDNNIRIRFSGDYWYHYRYVGLFDAAYEEDADVPAYMPYVSYQMPSDFYQIDRVDWTHPVGLEDAYTNYKIRRDGSAVYLLIRWEDAGEFTAQYFAYPTFITEPTFDDLTVSDDEVLTIPDEYFSALVQFIAAKLQIDESAYISEVMANNAKESLNNLETAREVPADNTGIIDENNW